MSLYSSPVTAVSNWQSARTSRLPTLRPRQAVLPTVTVFVTTASDAAELGQTLTGPDAAGTLTITGSSFPLAPVTAYDSQSS
jgi:hypothetical protein